MKELITRPQADLLFTVAPIAAAAVALAWWRLRQSPTGLAAGVGALLIGVLWRVFNGISERIGIETVANLLVNAAVFVVVGIGYGLWMRRFVPAPIEPVDTALIGFLSTEPAPTSASATAASSGATDGQAPVETVVETKGTPDEHGAGGSQVESPETDLETPIPSAVATDSTATDTAKKGTATGETESGS